MEDSHIAFLIGLMAGSIFFIDGWGPTEKINTGADGEKNEKGSLFASRRFRGLSVLIAGGIITPILDYVTKNTKPEFFMAYLKGCIYGWFFVLVFGLVLYLIWISSKKSKRVFIKNCGEFAYAILDFIYLGISDNPHLNAKRVSDVEYAKIEYEKENAFKLELLEREHESKNRDITPIDIDELDREKFKVQNKQSDAKTEADYDFSDWYYKGIAEYDKGEYEKCIAYLKNALDLSKTDLNVPDALLYIGISYDFIGQYDKATLQYDEIINNYPDYPKMYIVYYDKGVSLAKQNLLSDANIAYDKAIALNSQYENAWYNKGVNLGKLKQHDAAIKAYAEALKLNAKDFEAMFNIGDNLASLGRHEEAIKYYKDVTKLKPDFAKAWNFMGISLHRLGKDEEALKVYDKATELNPNDSNVWSNKAVSLNKVGKSDESLKALEEAIRLNPHDIDAIYNIAGAYALKNEKVNMLVNLKKAIEIDGANRVAAKKDEDFKAFWNDPDFKKLVE